MFNSDKINELISNLTKIPGFSKKSAEKFIYWILETPSLDVNLLVNKIKGIKSLSVICEFCNRTFIEENCDICFDDTRENKLLVLENMQNLNKIEKASFFRGKYFIFPYKLDDEKNLNEAQEYIDKLKNYSQNFDEVILGISPNLSGEITKNILKKELLKKGVNNISEFAIGVPVGASIDYLDEITLNFSLKNRK
ncbi:toprim domain-containing protein [Mycoplasma leonicaptivi]|uniref:toprim domain-containing protein n=1 Tax=Mycoplasma leonicaptivi TaxID=36742 RepID=UPI0004866B59|nr:toprim domain-containing protein [Mycoplasma leonicaptivi]